MLHECREAAVRARQWLFARRVERAGQQQGARIVVDTIAMRPVGHRMDGMLEQSGVIAHRQEMAELHLRRRQACCAQDLPSRPGRATAADGLARSALEQRAR